jgi:Xaa-Pro aminopeptidase
MNLALLVPLLLVSTAAPPPTSAPLVPDGAWLRIRKERVQTLLPRAMERAKVSAWVTLCRENANDPLASHVGCENAVAPSAIVFFHSAKGFRSVAYSGAGEAKALSEIGLHDQVIPVERGVDIYKTVADALAKEKPARIAVNSSIALPVADGLTATQREQLTRKLPASLRKRLVSSDELVYLWLSLKVPEEIEILRRAAALTAQLEEEAYRTVVPGKTRDSDVARFLRRRIKELGVEDAWQADQNPNVNSGVDRGHSHSTDRVILPGDFIQTDFGIKVGGLWVTDIQRFAYVLAPGQTQPPAEALERWKKSRQGNRVALAAMKPGVRGYDVDAAQRAYMKEVGSEPVPWGTGHPVGYWAHDVGPALSGAQTGKPPAGNSLRKLEPGQVFAFDGFFCWKLSTPGETKTLSVEEMAVVTEDGAEYLNPPQEELILIPSR